MSLNKTEHLSHFNRVCARCIIYLFLYNYLGSHVSEQDRTSFTFQQGLCSLYHISKYIITSKVMSLSKRNTFHISTRSVLVVPYILIYNYLGNHVSEQDRTSFTFQQGLCSLYHISKYIITSEVMSLSKTEHLSHFNKICARCIIYLNI